MIRASGKKVFLGGNLGAPFVGALAQDWDWGVVEISSFQLEWISEFRPRIAVLLNITEDHLERYPSFADYCAAKERIFEAQTSDDVAIHQPRRPFGLADARSHQGARDLLRFRGSPDRVIPGERPDRLAGWR